MLKMTREENDDLKSRLSEALEHLEWRNREFEVLKAESEKIRKNLKKKEKELGEALNECETLHRQLEEHGFINERLAEFEIQLQKVEKMKAAYEKKIEFLNKSLRDALAPSVREKESVVSELIEMDDFMTAGKSDNKDKSPFSGENTIEETRNKPIYENNLSARNKKSGAIKYEKIPSKSLVSEKRNEEDDDDWLIMLPED